MHRVWRGLRGLIVALLFWALPAAAEKSQPQLEVGAGLIELTRPNYRGSDHYSSSVLPLPYVIYRGDRVRITREGIKARLFSLDSLNVGLSSAFNLTGSRDDPARQGMPELRSTLEIGPSFDWRGSFSDYAWCFCTPVRFVTATDLGRYKPAGWITHPHFRLTRVDDVAGWEVQTTVSAGPVWATRKYHAYFYEVAPQYATPERPAFSAGGGYSGVRASLYIGLSRGNWRGGIGLLNDWLGGAAFAQSPLVKTRNATVVGIGLSYRLWSRGVVGAGEDAP